MNYTRLIIARASLALACLLAPVAGFAADGYANVSGTTTGGAGGTTVTVTNLTDFNLYAREAGSHVIQVQGTINLGSSNVRIGSNKTIIGLGTGSGFVGNLKAVDETNIVIQNLNFTNPSSVGDGDGLTLDGCNHVWVTKCSFVDCGDGALDITHGSDFITVSWCKFSYTVNSGHNFVNLVGHSDNNSGEDSGKLHVTFHHNWWSTLCVERMPRVRFGRIHSYNNYFNAPGNNYCVRAAMYSEVRLQNNYFENVDQPWEIYDVGSNQGKVNSSGDIFVNVTGQVAGTDSVFTVPYSFALEAASGVKASVMAGAGTGGSTPNPTVPGAPSGLTASAASSSQINLAWSDAASNETGFRIERATGSGSFAEIATVGANVTSYSNTGLAASTAYSFRVRAYNSAGNSSYSNTATATTGSSSNPAPTVSISSPANGASFTAGANITINATAADSNGTVTSVAFYRSGTLIGTDTSSPYSVVWTGATAGTFALTAVATDNGGASTTSSAVNITVNGSGGGTTTVTFESIGAEDGRVLESSETSGTGGSVDASGTSSSALRTGDDSSDRQYRTILSFDTSSLPDGATIVSATLRLVAGSSSGTSPFTTHGTCSVDIKGGTGFGGAVALATGDFQAAADATGVAAMSAVSADGQTSTGSINATGRGFINKTGKTQFRVAFTLDDNDDAGNDYTGWHSGNASTAANRPVLEIVYQ